MERGEGGGFTWGGVEGWGEKAYNCNCITIKKNKKNKLKKKKKKKDHMEVKKKKGKAKQNMSLEQVPKGATPGGRVEGVDDT